jgi:CBS domain-containing protein
MEVSILIVEEAMTPYLETIEDFEPLSAAAALMEELDIGMLAVLDPKCHVIGVVTDRDIVIRGVSHGCEPIYTPVSHVTTRFPVSCRCDASIETAMELMKKHKIRRLLVVDRYGFPVGILTLRDLAVHIENKEQRLGELLEYICRSPSSRRLKRNRRLSCLEA